MGLFLKHTEDKKYHIYKYSSKYTYILVNIIMIILAIASTLYFKLGKYLTAMYFYVPFLILVFLVLKEILSLNKNRDMALKDGKRQFVKGSFFHGNYELKIEK